MDTYWLMSLYYNYHCGVVWTLIGCCLQTGDSLDKLGRETFMPFVPEHHLIPGILPKDMWYFSYNFHPVKQVSGQLL